MRRLLRPTGFVDSPFGHDGKVVRLAGGLSWFASVELMNVENGRRVGSELLPVEGIENRFDENLARQWAALIASRPPLQLGERTVRLDQPQVMAVLNATPDSFSDGGQFADAGSAAQAGAGMAAAGAAIVDVGGESTRPGAQTVWEGDEIERVVPIVRQLAAGGAAVSIDTRKAAVMEASIGAGARLVNDVSALTFDARSADVIAAAGVPVVLMHHQGDPQAMQDDPRYDDVLVEIYEWLEERIAAAEAAGIARDKILIDPGFGFGKTVAHNLALLARLGEIAALGFPVLAGWSRKSSLGRITGRPADDRLAASVAAAMLAVQRGARIVRVHDVAATRDALAVLAAVEGSG
jgi:dihydropteroate synthase